MGRVDLVNCVFPSATEDAEDMMQSVKNHIILGDNKITWLLWWDWKSFCKQRYNLHKKIYNLLERFSSDRKHWNLNVGKVGGALTHCLVCEGVTQIGTISCHHYTKTMNQLRLWKPNRGYNAIKRTQKSYTSHLRIKLYQEYYTLDYTYICPTTHKYYNSPIHLKRSPKL